MFVFFSNKKCVVRPAVDGTLKSYSQLTLFRQPFWEKTRLKQSLLLCPPHPWCGGWYIWSSIRPVWAWPKITRDTVTPWTYILRHPTHEPLSPLVKTQNHFLTMANLFVAIRLKHSATLILPSLLKPPSRRTSSIIVSKLSFSQPCPQSSRCACVRACVRVCACVCCYCYCKAPCAPTLCSKWAL